MNALIQIIYLILIGLVAGWLAATLLGERRRYGVLGHIVVGVVGAIAGNYILIQLEWPNAGILFRLAAALGGSIVLILLLRLLRR
jgi:uncharacterized membrane protein YeaQ/YmgE (transglycosylase-associated protein family)